MLVIRLLKVTTFAVVAYVAASGYGWLQQTPMFALRNISFTVEFEHVRKDQLANAISRNLGGNFLSVDIDGIKTGIETLPWVYKVSVQRRWPYDLHVKFTEQKIIAHWREESWLNEYGDIVTGVEPKAGRALPYLTGPLGTQHAVLDQYRRFSALLSGIDVNVTTLLFSSRRTWEMRLDNGMVLVLDRYAPEEKLKRFVRVYRRTFAGQDAPLQYVDLRYTNGFALRQAAQKAQRIVKRRIENDHSITQRQDEG